MKRTSLYFFGAAMLSGSMLFAQTTTPVNPQNKDQVNDRRENQQDRIGQGVKSGQLTAGETKNLEGREANLNREIHADRSANGGKLTAAERQQVNHQQNTLSKSIYADKHNAADQNFKGQVGARQENQQDRIAQGIKSGSMTAGEAARAENRQQGINQQIHADRAATSKREIRLLSRFTGANPHVAIVGVPSLPFDVSDLEALRAIADQMTMTAAG